MATKFNTTSLPGVILIEPQVFEDPRGFFMETFHKKKYAWRALTVSLYRTITPIQSKAPFEGFTINSGMLKGN